jgi:hypothetical protein
LFVRTVERAMHSLPSLVYKIAETNNLDIPFDMGSPSEYRIYFSKNCPIQQNKILLAYMAMLEMFFRTTLRLEVKFLQSRI